MLDFLKTKAFADPYSAPSLIRRLLADHAITQWRSYVFVALMMGVMAACTAAAAYLIGSAVNAAYVSRNITAVASVCVAIIVVSAVRGLSS